MLDHAIKLARTLKEQKYNIACVITDKKGHLVSTGLNSYTKSHPRMLYYTQKIGNGFQLYLHSEIAAIIKARGRGHTAYIARVDKEGNPLPVHPCPLCTLALQDVKIKRIITT